MYVWMDGWMHAQKLLGSKMLKKYNETPPASEQSVSRPGM